ICLFCLPLLFIPPFFLRDPRDWWILELIIESNNAVIAAVAPVFACFIVYAFEQVRVFVLPMRFQRSIRPNREQIGRTYSLSFEADQH
ncbi:hypothetical protein PFISCL1PPCAC_7320, partial [Pristionchus fissidentatus]